MASGAPQVRYGTVPGTGADLPVELGFRPRKVELFNTDGNCQAVWCHPMPAAAMQKTVDSGAGATDISTVTAGGVTPSANGFTLGTDADLNVSGETLYWVATE